jgi:hypothetical protein
MEGLALLALFICISMMLRWLVVHDATPEKKTGGLFAMREPGDFPGDTDANRKSR